MVGNRPSICAPRPAPVGGTAGPPELCSGPSSEPRATGPSFPCPVHAPHPAAGDTVLDATCPPSSSCCPSHHSSASPQRTAPSGYGRGAHGTQVCWLLWSWAEGGGCTDVPETKQLCPGDPRGQSGPSSVCAPATSPGRLWGHICPSYLKLGAPELSVPRCLPLHSGVIGGTPHGIGVTCTEQRMRCRPTWACGCMGQARRGQRNLWALLGSSGNHRTTDPQIPTLPCSAYPVIRGQCHPGPVSLAGSRASAGLVPSSLSPVSLEKTTALVKHGRPVKDPSPNRSHRT